MDPTLVNLVERFRAGDKEAAGELFERFSSQMLALVHRHPGLCAEPGGL